MSTYLTDMETAVRILLQDQAANDDDKILTSSELQSIITDHALYRFSKDFPYLRKKYYNGAGEYDYEQPSDWQDDFSRIESIEFDTDEQNPDMEEGKDYQVYTPDISHYTIDSATAAGTSVTLSTAAEAAFFKNGNVIIVGDDDATETRRVATDGVKSTGVVIIDALTNTYDASPYIYKPKVVRFLVDTPGTSETFLIEYTTIHTLTEATKTIPTVLDGAFKSLAAANCALVIANRYSQSSDSSISADAVDYGAKAENWQSASKTLYAMYNRFRGTDENVKPSCAFGDLDKKMPWGKDYLTHPHRWR